MNQTTKEQGKQVREEIRNSIIEYIEKYGYPPTVRDIGEMNEIKSTSNVKHHLDQMIADGILETSHESSPRAIRVPGYRFAKEEDIDKLYLAKCEEINTLQKAAGKQREEFEPEYLGDNPAIGCRDGRCKCGNVVRSYQNFCGECGIQLNWGNVWGNVHREQDKGGTEE